MKGKTLTIYVCAASKGIGRYIDRYISAADNLLFAAWDNATQNAGLGSFMGQHSRNPSQLIVLQGP